MYKGVSVKVISTSLGAIFSSCSKRSKIKLYRFFLDAMERPSNKEISIDEAHAINKSYPNFFNDLRKLGIEVIENDI